MERDRPIQQRTWDYPLDASGEVSAESVLREINGVHLTLRRRLSQPGWHHCRDRQHAAREVFVLPAAAHTEKSGSLTQTQRMLQWHHKAVDPPGDCRSELEFFYLPTSPASAATTAPTARSST